VVPEVAFLHDKAVGPETEQRHPCQILIGVMSVIQQGALGASRGLLARPVICWKVPVV